MIWLCINHSEGDHFESGFALLHTWLRPPVIDQCNSCPLAQFLLLAGVGVFDVCALLLSIGSFALLTRVTQRYKHSSIRKSCMVGTCLPPNTQIQLQVQAQIHMMSSIRKSGNVGTCLHALVGKWRRYLTACHWKSSIFVPTHRGKCNFFSTMKNFQKSL